MSDSNITAKLVYDGRQVYLPNAIGTPNPNQLNGTTAEILSELAGRICYDSLGSPTARDSASYHQHILQVGHYSVYEHYNFTIIIHPYDLYPQQSPNYKVFHRSTPIEAFAIPLLNRPGIFVDFSNSGDYFIITANLRTVLDFQKFKSPAAYADIEYCLFNTLYNAANKISPQVIPCLTGNANSILNYRLLSTLDLNQHPFQNSSHKWLSFYLSGSRGFSHEQVRHGDFTAISQRSTRYVDESDSPWVEHPLLTKFLADPNVDKATKRTILQARDGEDRPELPEVLAAYHQPGAIDYCKNLYSLLSRELQTYLFLSGTDKQTARKQARGAARGYLGITLSTEMIFSASIPQWKWMLQQRGNPAADAEIREVFCQILRELQSDYCYYKAEFSEFSLSPSPDGIGECVVCNV